MLKYQLKQLFIVPNYTTVLRAEKSYYTRLFFEIQIVHNYFRRNLYQLIRDKISKISLHSLLFDLRFETIYDPLQPPDHALPSTPFEDCKEVIVLPPINPVAVGD